MSSGYNCIKRQQTRDLIHKNTSIVHLQLCQVGMKYLCIPWNDDSIWCDSHISPFYLVNVLLTKLNERSL